MNLNTKAQSREDTKGKSETTKTLYSSRVFVSSRPRVPEKARKTSTENYTCLPQILTFGGLTSELVAIKIVSMRTKLASEEERPEVSPEFIHNLMRKMAPHQCPAGQEEISTVGAIMCSIRMLGAISERAGNRILEEHGLTFPQWLALGCISHAGEEGIPHAQLGQQLMLSKAPVTGLMDRLERAGFVERRADAKDRRVSRAVATEEGKAIWWRLQSQLVEKGSHICASNLSDEEQNQLLNLLGRLLHGFASHDPMMTEFNKENL